MLAWGSLTLVPSRPDRRRTLTPVPPGSGHHERGI